MSIAKGNKPDYSIHALNKLTRGQAKVGVAWDKPDGTIAVKFEEFIDLNLLRGPELVVTLFPESPERRAKRFVNKP